MCGIFAAFGLAIPERRVAEFRHAVEIVCHRGPDHLGTFSDPHCFLGHTRLSILGLEASGNQPFQFENLVMTYNGEVFNYLELRDELAALGYSFSTGSDTEVVIKAFHKWGVECFSRFNGMWALVIYDREKKKIYASRDRFGQKPLFVMNDGAATLFASEFQQLSPFADGEIDYGLIQMFLKEGTYEGEGRTFLRGIQEFPKAHVCEISLDGSVRSIRYWDYWNGPVAKVTEATYQEFEALLKDSVALRLRADVPFGLLLSGGVDSTIVAAYAAEATPSQTIIPAFTYASGDKDDERLYAQEVADELGLSLTIREQETAAGDYIARLEKLVRHLGRGHSSPAVVSVDYLYNSVRASAIKVAIDGQGADELLAGYKHYFAFLVPWLALRGKFLEAGCALVDQFRSGFFSSIILYIRNVAPSPVRKLMRQVYGYERFFENIPEARPADYVKHQKSHSRNGNALNRYLIRQHNVGLENLLFYGDIVAMNNSVENRSPFMDHRLVDFVFSKAEELKVHRGIEKYALRRLPIYKRFAKQLNRKKVGFSSDIRPATKHMMVRDLRNSPILDWPIFTAALRSMVAGGKIESAKYERLLFRLYQVHLWNKVFVSGQVTHVNAGLDDVKVSACA